MLTFDFSDTCFVLDFIFPCWPMSTESAKREYFERNFAWHAITQFNGDLSCNCDNATIMFLRPIPTASSRDRLGLMVSK